MLRGLRQEYLPHICQGCRRREFGGEREPIYIPWLWTQDGRVVWYLLVCWACWRQLPEHVRWSAVNPPEPRPSQPARSEPAPRPAGDPHALPRAGSGSESEAESAPAPRRQRWGKAGPRRWRRGARA